MNEIHIKEPPVGAIKKKESIWDFEVLKDEDFTLKRLTEILKTIDTLPRRTEDNIFFLRTLTPLNSYDHVDDILEEVAKEEKEEAKKKIHPRTLLLVQDYREFKAARIIQSAFRAWYEHRIFHKKKHAAKVIQTIWRGFAARRFYYRKLENMVQQRIEQYYAKAAIKIQAFWRGCWIRKTVHDQFRKKRMQIRAAEDLLHCIAFKLHHLLRTYQIPGIYSLRNSKCLSKVENLLYKIRFKQYNDQIRKLNDQREEHIRKAKTKHKKSAFCTEIPYGGPNPQLLCEPKCCEFYKSDDDIDAKMFRILSLYEQAARKDKRIDRARRRQMRERQTLKLRRKKRDFCADVIKSMKKWNIIQDNKIRFNKEIFNTPESLQDFLTEIASFGVALEARCHCFVDIKQLIANQTD